MRRMGGEAIVSFVDGVADSLSDTVDASVCAQQDVEKALTQRQHFLTVLRPPMVHESPSIGGAANGSGTAIRGASIFPLIVAIVWRGPQERGYSCGVLYPVFPVISCF
jgi:hypothetical protein